MTALELSFYWQPHQQLTIFGVCMHRDKEYICIYCGIKTSRHALLLPWAEAHCRGHMLSARHSTNHLGEGLRQEPIVTLAGYHLIRVSEWTVNMGRRERPQQEKLVGAVSQHRRWMRRSLAWNRSRLANECDVWGGAQLQNPIQTTLPPRFIPFTHYISIFIRF